MYAKDRTTTTPKAPRARSPLPPPMALPDDDALLDRTEVASVLRCGVSTIGHRLRTDPKFPRPIYLSARATRWRASAVRAYLAALQTEARAA